MVFAEFQNAPRVCETPDNWQKTLNGEYKLSIKMFRLTYIINAALTFAVETDRKMNIAEALKGVG